MELTELSETMENNMSSNKRENSTNFHFNCSIFCEQKCTKSLNGIIVASVACVMHRYETEMEN